MTLVDLLRNGIDDLLVAFLEETTNEENYFPLNHKQTLANQLILCIRQFINGDDLFEDIEEIRITKTYLILKSWVLANLNQEIKNVKNSLQQVFFYLIATEYSYLQLPMREGGKLQ